MTDNAPNPFENLWTDPAPASVGVELSESTLGETCIECPRCEGTYMHADAVDAQDLGDIRIRFWCEGCGGDAKVFTTLRIKQHKGETEVSWLEGEDIAPERQSKARAAAILRGEDPAA